MMWFVESLIDLLPLTPVQEDDLWGYAQCLIDDEGIVGEALEVELLSYVESEYGITVTL